MKFTTAPTAEVANQADCLLIDHVLREFPGRGAPYGRSNLFLEASPEDAAYAQEIGEAALSLGGLIRQVHDQAGIIDANGCRREGTLDTFKPHVITNGAIVVLRTATLLAAVQPIPKHDPLDPSYHTTRMDERQCDAVARVIGDARLLGSMIRGAGLVSSEMSPLESRFVNSARGDSFVRSAADAALVHLKSVWAEFLDAEHGVNGVPLDVHLHPGHSGYFERGGPVVETYDEYVQENPIIAQLAKQRRDIAC